jgi:hypothetical protein
MQHATLYAYRITVEGRVPRSARISCRGPPYEKKSVRTIVQPTTEATAFAPLAVLSASVADFLGTRKRERTGLLTCARRALTPAEGGAAGAVLRPACPPARLEVVRRRASRDDGSALLSRRCSRRHGRRVAARCGAGALGPRRVGPAYNRSTGRCPRAPSSPWPPSGVVSHGFC